jgi:conjugal transfer pilus assembly protein TraB
MSNGKGGLGGLFVNKKATAAPAAPAGGKPKNVKQRWMLMGVGAICFIVTASTMFGGKPEPVRSAKKSDDGAVLVTPGNVDKKDWMTQSSEQLRRTEMENSELRSKLESLTNKVNNLQTGKQGASAPVELPPNIVPPPMATGPQAGTPATVSPPPAPPLPPAAAVVPVPAGALPMPSAAPELPQTPKIFKPAAKTASAAPQAEVVKAQVKYTKNPYSGFLPAGAFAPVALLNGLDAGTSSATQANPLPILLNITDHATLPGTAKYSIKSCFVLGTGYGDLSAERVYGRISRMSCVDKRDRLVLSTDVSGYLVDSDGKIGLRGKVVDRQGAKLGKAVLAGFAQGLSGAFGQAQGVMTTTVAGATTSIGGDAALRAAGLNGAQSAAQQLAQFYLKEAQAIFPVITVDAGRTGSIVFTDNAQLTWSAGEAQYVKDVRPEK